MDFSLTDEQRLFQDELDKSLAALAPLSRVRQHAAEAGSFADDLWRGLCELGIPGALVPEASGGLGLGILDAALIAEKFGKHAVPAPFLGTVVLAPLALTMAGSEQQQANLLPSLADGTLRIAVGVSERTAGAREGAGVDSRDGRIYGRAHFVIDSGGAHMFLIADRDGGLHLVDRAAPGIEVVALDTVDRTRDTAMLTFDGVPAEPLPTSDALPRIADAARVVLAADLLGAAWNMLDQAIEYAKVRHQFGRPIGSFQAVKHMCAEMAAELEPGRALIWYAGYALDKRLPDANLCALHAKAYLADAARFVARTATEVHGGMGITDELGLHFWLKRIGWSYQAFGSPERLREEAAAVQGLIPAAAIHAGMTAAHT
jgi:alkylation response protein AidB-like acyl-CoA dehydrogenase